MVDAVGYHRHACATPAAENDDLLSSGSAVIDALQERIFDGHLQDFGGSPGGDSALWVPGSIPPFYATTLSLFSAMEPSPPPAQPKYQPYIPPPLPPRCVERGLASSRRQLEGPAGGLAPRVADPQLPVFAHAGNRVTASPTFSQPPIITIVIDIATPHPPCMVMPNDPPFYYDLAARFHGTSKLTYPRCSRPRPSCMSGRTSAASSSSGLHGLNHPPH
ncbi:hypothetical protein EDB83DRAFT_2679073, partial [Lactarius deliciosus]